MPYAITDTMVDAEPDRLLHQMIVWSRAQSQDVWGQMISTYVNDLVAEEDGFVRWMVDQPSMAKANTVRLFWRLLMFEPGLYYASPSVLSDEIHWGDVKYDMTRALADRLAAGFYSVSDLGVSQDELFVYVTIFEYLRRGLDQSTLSAPAAFSIPPAALSPIPGRELSTSPAFIDVPLFDPSDEECLEYREICFTITQRGPRQFDEDRERAVRFASLM